MNKKSKRLLQWMLVGAMGISWTGSAFAASGSADQITVKEYHIPAQSIVSQQEVEDLFRGKIGQPADLSELEKQADALTQYLRAKGYMVAFAYLPQQDFASGKVRFEVVPGQYDQIIIVNKTEIEESAIRRQLGKVQNNAVIRKDDLERALWLIGDLAGAEAKTTLQPGSKPGTTNLTINVNAKGKPSWGYVSYDNGGNRYTGRYQYGLSLNQANPARQGDVLSLRGSYSGEGLWNGSLAYQTPAFAQGDKIGISYSHTYYLLGEDIRFLDAYGTADAGSFFYQHTLQRSRKANSYLQIRYENKELRDTIAAVQLEGHKRIHSWTAVFNGDSLDNWGGGGSNTYLFSYTAGKLSILDAINRYVDDMTGQTHGSYGKYNISLTRLQQLTERTALFAGVNWQGATKNLDSSEKMSLGGPFGVRAYPSGEASGDEGWSATLEYRYNLPMKEGAKDSYQLICFADGGSVRINKHPYTADSNTRSLYGAGVGINWSRENNYAARLHYAWKLGSAQAVSDTDRSGRLWFQLYRFF